MGNVLFLNKPDTERSPEQVTKTHYGVLNLEKRKYPRFSVDLPVDYLRVESSTGTVGRAFDFSEGGLLIYFPEQMEIGQRLSIKLFLSMGSKLIPIEILSEVAWVEICVEQDWGEYRTGVKFVDISPEDMAKLKKFLISLSQPPYTR